MSSPTPTFDPIQFSNYWSRFLLAGVTSPGTIPRGGIRGFKRETGWDKKKGKGVKGAYLTLTTQPPCEGTIALQLFTAADFASWDDFVARALSIAPEKQKSTGLSIYYPGFSSIGLTAVVVKNYSPPEHQGKSLYVVTIELIEWSQPPAVSIVSTPSKTGPDGNPNGAPPVKERSPQQQQDDYDLQFRKNQLQALDAAGVP